MLTKIWPFCRRISVSQLTTGFQEAGAQFAAPAKDPTTDTDFESLEALANAIALAQRIDRPTEETWSLARNLLKNFESLLAIQRANFETLQKHGVDWQVFNAFQCMYNFQRQALEEPLKRRTSISSWKELGASAIILTHNHPSGDPTPSPEDIAMTKQVAAACGAIGVIVHDHVVVGKRFEGDRRGDHVQSFRALGLL